MPDEPKRCQEPPVVNLLPDRPMTDTELALHMAASVESMTNTTSRGFTVDALESLGYTVIGPDEGTDASMPYEAVSPRVTVACPKCGTKAVVTSSPEKLRRYKCTNEDCAYQFKISKHS
jgi:hypothetical protein